MPIYEYQCLKCGKIVEALKGVNDPPPKCHGPMKKLISKGSFILKGKGWYATDYKGTKDEAKNNSKKDAP
jgi:putative FmdB family regulatory protein